LALLVLTDYGELSLTVFATRPSQAKTVTGCVPVAETMAERRLLLSDEIATLASPPLGELAVALGSALLRRQLADPLDYQRPFRRW
jgi:hypothetical protein